MQTGLHPEARSRRSFIHHRLSRDGAIFGEVGDAIAAVRFGEAEAEAQRARQLGLLDASPLDRTGFKGSRCLAWLREQGVEGLTENNRTYRLRTGELAARLAPTEAMIIGGLAGEQELCRRLADEHSARPVKGCYSVMRRDANFCFVLLGTDAGQAMARLCAVDLRIDRFPDGAVAQTMAAGLPLIVIRFDIGNIPALHLLGNSACAEFFWDCLLDALIPLGGRTVGLAAIQE